ncbi:helix-turn-helix domain-containing protein [Nocardia yunnanensis]|uniref:Helix-turn-helix domain-containing protein n=1 Tax=Nocardia yunnanensis TaxID=2382165 RepID=A0A386ZJL5_9NOCA|nr:helix-turn-helix domain-containing protein [Nocardia yunnanensis]AYF77741.1 helix-turn-helix domain-containing protein [Nocardia yunnanensis]
MAVSAQFDHLAGSDERFAARLRWLLDRPGPDGRPIHAREIFARANARGYRISRPYLSQLRSGRRTRPSAQVVEALAHGLGVEPEFLLCGAPDPQADRQHIEALADERLRRLLRAAAALPGECQQMLADTAERFRAADELPPLDYTAG